MLKDGHSVGSVMEIIEAEYSTGNGKQKSSARSEIFRAVIENFWFKCWLATTKLVSSVNSVLLYGQKYIFIQSIRLETGM